MTREQPALAAALAAAIWIASQASEATAGGIPVFDASNLSQQVKQVIEMQKQLDALNRQVAAAEGTRDALKGVRNMAGIIDTLYDLTTTVDTQEVLYTSGIRSAEHYGLQGDMALFYQDQNRQAAAWVANSQRFMGQANDRFSTLRTLIDKIDDSPDPKDIMDLSARIQAESVFLENELVRLQMMKSEAEAQQALNRRRATQLRLEMIKGNTTRF
ncbi:type IV secretion system protein [Marinobacterium arenosum]|uniref:type IV secretion system protein n=1 Tax=Marinobacterium arenosum TaxID=2862496 RepID=UPI001C938FF1|nr:type IV secretion system protein [Marinobacterium arenosum]MBY4677961.1 type IV secretion system protein [Marinobacterium arenosum]